MARRRRTGGGSVTTRLALLVTLPAVALGVLGAQRVDEDREEARAARAVVESVELQSSAAAVVGPAQLERTALVGLSSLDAVGVPREAVVDLSGVDLEEIVEPNSIALDRALTRLRRDHGDVALGDGTTLAGRLDAITAELTEQRALSDRRIATGADVERLFDLLESTVKETFERAEQVAGDRPGSSDERSRLSALIDVTTAGGDSVRAMLTNLLDRSTANSIDLVSADERLRSMVDVYRGQLDAEHAAGFAEVDATLGRIDPGLVALDDSPKESRLYDADYVSLGATTLLDRVAYLEALQGYSADVSAQAVSELQRRADAKDSSVRTTVAGVAGVTVATLALLVLVGLSVFRPLRRLTDLARRVGHGELDPRPLPVTGPSDVRVLTASMNRMVETLHGVELQLHALAEGGGAGVPDAAPGTIGITLRRSFDKVRSMTAQLHESEQLSSAIVAQAADAIWTIDADRRIRSANGAAAMLLGVTVDDQIGRPIADFLRTLGGESALVHDPSSDVRCLVTSSQVAGASEPLRVVIAHDLTERVRFEERLEYQASHDALTGLPNRFALLDHLGSIAGDEPIAVLFVDLDGFKQINDVQGHVTGDRVLADVGERLSAVVDGTGVVGRLGGDEFVVVLTGERDLDELTTLGRELIARIELPPYGGDETFTLSASVGVASLPEGLAAAGLSPLDAIRRADSAVYHAKERGRGRVEVFDRDLQAAIVHGAELEMALRQAIADDELELHLQPVMDLASGRFTSAEALVRWNRPGHGMIPPDDFIPVAERSSLVLQLDRWVIGRACATLARWRDLDPTADVRIAVNISGRHLLDGSLVADLDAALAATGADPTLLEIELTETQLVDDLDRATELLDDVRRRGITVAIDDFGTGYSSMAYLQRLPIDTLKIDRSFISGMSDDVPFDTTVLDALLTIGGSLGTSVVAEGIETPAQLDFLRARGCDRGQGFLMARPMPIAEAEAAMRATAIVTAPDDARCVECATLRREVGCRCPVRAAVAG